MSDDLIINKFRELPVANDFYELRKRGIDLLVNLGSSFYTDHNISDPGITILEALCLAITEAGYRTGFPVKDIFASDPELPGLNQAFFTARDILTCNPVTINDFRKVMIDVEGIKNAWIRTGASQETNFWADCKKNKLNYYGKEIKFDKYSAERTNDIWTAILEEDNLKTVTIKFAKHITYTSDSYQRAKIEFSLPGWNVIHNQFSLFKPFINIEKFEDQVTSITLSNEMYNPGTRTWQGNVKVDFSSKGAPHTVVLQNVVVKPLKNEDELDLAKAMLKDKFLDSLLQNYHKYLYLTIARKFFHDVVIEGLYDILIELDDDEQSGDLNSEIIYFDLDYKSGGEWVTKAIEILFPEWDEVIDFKPESDRFIHAEKILSVSFLNDFYDLNDQKWLADLSIKYESGENTGNFIIKDVIFNHVASEDLGALKDEITNVFEASIIPVFHKKMKRISEILKALQRKLHQNRNLCEDYRTIKGVKTEEIGVCADITIANDASMEEIMAQIFFRIEQYFSPEINFYTLKEMEDKGYATGEIFEGPAMDHGFIVEEELEAAELRRNVYVSDLINLIMDIEGVIHVKNMMLTRFDDDGKAILPSAKWCLPIRPDHKPKLAFSKTKILVFKDGYPFSPNASQKTEIMRILEKLKAVNKKPKLQGSVGDYPIPQGIPPDLDQYTPIRVLFPQNFGIGAAGLPDTSTEDRKAKAKQLKAYLLFFDQILANFLSQLENVKSLYSINPTSDKTYFDHFLSDKVNGEDLYVDAVWLKNHLHDLLEPKDLYHDRRNRFLDHLLARFGEQFNEYTFLMNSLEGRRSPEILIQDKVSFLEKYPEISSQRGKAFNYKDEVWDTENVTGLKKRVGRLLGIEDLSRKNLFCPTICDNFIIENIAGEGDPPQYNFRLEIEGNTVFSSVDTFDSEEEAFDAKEDTILEAGEPGAYDFPEDSGKFRFRISSAARHLAVSEENYPSMDEAKNTAEELWKKFEKDLDEPCENEGLHVVEHILLRPESEDDLFLPVCLDEDCEFCGEEDPYSFRITIILPYWPARFSSNQIAFRRYVEKLIRLETPAHIMPKICWINNKQMRAFETAYRRWLEEQSKEFPDRNILLSRKNRLIKIFKSLKSIFPEATLHDCASGKPGSVKLDHTILGTLKSENDGNDHSA